MFDPQLDPLEGLDMPAESTFGRQYLSKLDAILDRHKHQHTNGTSGTGDVPPQGRARERRSTSPLPFSAVHRPCTKHVPLVSSEGEWSSSTSSLISSDDEMEQRRRSHSLNVPSARVELKTRRGSEQVSSPVKRKETHGKHRLEVGGQSHNPSQAAVLHSLHSINSQLGQLLNKVGTGGKPGEGLNVSNGHAHPGGGAGVHPEYTPLSLEEMSSSSR